MAEFKVGDEVTVILVGIGGRRIHMLHKVKRVVTRFVELDDGSKWGHDGWPYPRRSGFDKPHMAHATDELRANAARDRAIGMFLRALRIVDDKIVRPENFDGISRDAIEAATAALAKLEVKA